MRLRREFTSDAGVGAVPCVILTIGGVIFAGIRASSLVELACWVSERFFPSREARG